MVRSAVARVVLLDQRAGSRHGKADQDHERDDRPDDLDGGRMMERRRHRVLRAAVREDRIEHHAEHHHGDRHADPERGHVQVPDFIADVGHAFRQVPVGRFLEVRSTGCEASSDARHREHQATQATNQVRHIRLSSPAIKIISCHPVTGRPALSNDSTRHPASISSRSRAASCSRSSSVRHRPRTSRREPLYRLSRRRIVPVNPLLQQHPRRRPCPVDR